MPWWFTVDLIYTWWVLTLDACDKNMIGARQGFMRSFGLSEAEWYAWWPTISRGITRALEER